MSIAAGATNYMSNASILAWMETKTENLYTKMRSAMDQSNTRVAAEDALNDIKGKIDSLQASGDDPRALLDQIQETIELYGAEFPEVREVLEPIASELSGQIKDAALTRGSSDAPPHDLAGQRSGTINADPKPDPDPDPNPTPSTGESVGKNDDPLLSTDNPHAKISSDDAKRWGDQIGKKVDALGKQDQLGMIYLQEVNGQLNRTKDVASALMASADKAADNIVSHIG